MATRSARLWLARLLALAPITVSLAACEQPGTESAFAYPDAERSSHVDDYFGTSVPDPYRWMESLESAEVGDWVQAENALAEPFLEGLERRAAIIERLTELWDYERFGVPSKEGGRYFFTGNDGLQDQDVLYVSESLDAAPRMLIDPNAFSSDATVSLAGSSVSPDGRYIAYAKSDGGTDWNTWHVRDVETGDDLDDVLAHTKFTTPSWLPDGSGFFYSRYPLASDGTGDGQAQVRIFFHRIGTPQDDDELVFEISDSESRNPYPTVTEDGRYLIIRVMDGYDRNGIYYRDLSADDGDVVRLLDAWDALYTFIGNDGPTFYFQTNRGAPRNRVIAIDTGNPDPANWRVVIPEAEEALQGTTFVGGHFVAQYLRDARAYARVFDGVGDPVRDVEFPGIGTVGGFGGHASDSETFYAFQSYTVPPTIYRYDVATGESSVYRETRIDVPLDGYETHQVFVTSKDGTRVPMFVTHREGLTMDGQNPTLLYGYGGFNIPASPGFSVQRLVWMEMGGVFAHAALRGGSEYGEEWHLAGTKLQKQNVFDDFIASSEFLIEQGYTSTPKLAIQGGSNGGLLVGAVTTQRPELFGAALPSVGVLDMLRYHTPSLNARQWSTDLGLSENEDEFGALFAYSPYHNVEEGVCYPPTLVTTADRDDRVVPWHSFKFGAALQHAQSCENPVLVRVETRAGHGAGKPTWMRIEETADAWAFLAWALDM